VRAEARKAKATFEEVRTILNKDWQPIPGVPEDEWDSYVWPVVGLLQRKAKRQEVEAYLRRTAEKTIGMPVPDERLASVVGKLMALNVG
jgi:hypothetical protein